MLYLSGLLEGSGWRENMNYIEESINKQVVTLTFKAPSTTAADDKFCDIFPNFCKK